MTNQLYIKTDGPVPEGSEFEIGKLYKAKRIDNKRYGIEFRHPNGKDEFAVLRGTSAWLDHMSGFVLCDSTGNPVAAPWEEASKPQACSKECELDPDWPVCGLEFVDDGSGICGRRNSQGRPCWHLESCHKQVNYRAHAEALAELLTIARCPDASCDNNGTTVHETVSTTIGCCGIYLPDGQCCGNGVPEAVQDIEPAPCQWCHERTKALAAFDQAKGV